MKMDQHLKGYLMVAGAAICFGVVGIPGKILLDHQIPPLTIGLWRLLLGFIMLFLFLLIKNPQLLKIDKKGLIYCALLGLVSNALQNFFYFNALQRTTMATTTVLLYTAPVFIIIMARIFYKELLTPVKVISLFLCIGGCFLTITGGDLAVLKLSLLGVLMGIGSGFCFAFLTIFSRALLDSYNQLTIILYAFGFGTLFLMLFVNPVGIFRQNLNLKIWLTLLSIGFVSTVLSYVLYVTGISSGIESSKTGIISTFEVVVSVVCAFIFFDEKIFGWKLIGILMVIASVIIVQVVKKESKRIVATDASIDLTQ